MRARLARQSDKDLPTTVLLSFFLGAVSADDFYLGYTGLGILKLLTLACCAFGLLVATLRYTWGADRATARNNGQELTFEGHVKTRIVSQSELAPGEDAKRTNP